MRHPCHIWITAMTQRHPFRRIAKWTGTILCAVISALWISSTLRDIEPNWLQAVTFHDGCIEFTFRQRQLLPSQREADQVIPDLHFHRGDHGLHLPQLDAACPDGWDFYLPLWLPLLALIIPTAALWRSDRRAPPPGHCPHCTYNLYASTTGICPECGAPTSKRQHPATSLPSE